MSVCMIPALAVALVGTMFDRHYDRGLGFVLGRSLHYGYVTHSDKIILL